MNKLMTKSDSMRPLGRQPPGRLAGWDPPWAFVLALACVLVWASLGPYSSYSDTWQLIINTATTVITFLIVFLIQTHRIETPVRCT